MASETARRPRHKLRVPRARRGDVRILAGTRKGAFVVHGDAERRRFTVDPDPWHLGSTVFHVAPDPRAKDGSRVLAALRTPDGVPTVVHSDDGGARWQESAAPPRFSEETGGSAGPSRFDRAVNQVFWLTPGHRLRPGSWFAGTSPQGLFHTDDHGRTWEPVLGLHHHPSFDAWTRPDEQRTPDGAKLHSILVDPRDADHLYVALSAGVVLESRDGGLGWAPVGELPEGAGSPHALAFAPTDPDLLWLQARGGVYRCELDEGEVWERAGPRADDGTWLDAGFPVATHPADPDAAFLVPMDASDAWSRTSPGGRPAVFRTRDRGATWQRIERGFPKAPSWWTVKRQCLAVDGHDPLGVYFGTSSGEIWGSRDEGSSFFQVARGLPHIYSLEVG
ncbi:MAG: glycosyl hydrolase [Planctomycetota bacterium]